MINSNSHVVQVQISKQIWERGKPQHEQLLDKREITKLNQVSYMNLWRRWSQRNGNAKKLMEGETSTSRIW